MKTEHFFNLSGEMVEICWVHPFAMHRKQKSAQLIDFCTSFPHNPHPAKQILAQSLLHKTWKLAASKGHWWHSNKRGLCCYCFCLPLLPIALSRAHCIGQAFGGSRSSGQLPKASNQQSTAISTKKWKSTLIRWIILISFLHCPSVNQQIIQAIPTFCSALWPSCLLQKERRQLPGPGMVWVQQRPQRKAREWLTPHSPMGPRKKWRKLLPIWELLCNRHCNAMFAYNIRTGIATCGGWIWWICSSDSMW